MVYSRTKYVELQYHVVHAVRDVTLKSNTLDTSLSKEARRRDEQGDDAIYLRAMMCYDVLCCVACGVASLS